MVQLNQWTTVTLHTEHRAGQRADTDPGCVFMQTPAKIISMPDSVCTIITTINLINIISVSVDNSLLKINNRAISQIKGAHLTQECRTPGLECRCCFSLKDSPWKRTGPTLPDEEKNRFTLSWTTETCRFTRVVEERGQAVAGFIPVCYDIARCVPRLWRCCKFSTLNLLAPPIQEPHSFSSRCPLCLNPPHLLGSRTNVEYRGGGNQ